MKFRPMQDRVLIRGVDALELDAEVLADHLAAGENGDVLGDRRIRAPLTAPGELGASSENGIVRRHVDLI
jgi:hypothetical protein